MRPNPRSVLRCVLAALALCLVAAPAAAQAALSMSVTPVFPATVTEGQSGLAADVVIVNQNTAPDGALTLCYFAEPAPCPAGEGITVLASCGAIDPSVACTAADPGSFYLDPNAVGRAGTACAGVPFTVSEIGTTSRYRFDAASTIVLPGSGSTCRITFTFYVFAPPDVDADPTPNNGLQTYSIAAASARTSTPASASARGADITTVAPQPPPAVAPPPPLLTSSVPGGTANDNTPQIKGGAALGSTVSLHTNANCTSPVVGAGPAFAFASTGIAVTTPVPDNSTTSFYATAATVNGTSQCSETSVSYVEDSTPPAAPVVTGTTPTTPSTNNAPRVQGIADAGTTVRIYPNPTCTGAAIGEGPAAEFASPGITALVGDNTTTSFYASASDGANTSPCSTTFKQYTEVTSPPAPPTFSDTDPDSPGNQNFPRIKGSAAAGSFVRLYANPACAGFPAAQGSAAEFASPGLEASVLNDFSTTLYGIATDPLGNASACSTASITYVEDSTPPQTTIDSGPSGTIAFDAPARFAFSSSEPGSRFECRLGSATFAACTSPRTLPAATPSGARRFEVRAIDRAGNVDTTPASRTFTIGPEALAAPPPGCTVRGRRKTGTARNDTLTGSSISDCLYGEAGSDRLRGGSGNDRLFGGPGADRLEGEGGNDRLTGATGNDRLTDRSGRDSFSGGAGNDTIDARDTSLGGRRLRDTVGCGSGSRDVAIVDRRDLVLRDCERVRRR